MKPYPSFIVLNTTESTNNYAMEQIKADLAAPGMAWFSTRQTAGKGQRGKSWVVEPDLSLSMSLAIQPLQVFRPDRFHYNAFIALSCLKFLRKLVPDNLSIKWPNDLYWGDRKAGGILTENLLLGSDWKWAITGIGLNINQIGFPVDLPNAVSLRMASGVEYDINEIATGLHRHLLDEFDHIPDTDLLMAEFNENLYKKSHSVRLKRDNVSFLTTIDSVNEYGQLLTHDAVERLFSVGDVSWE